MPNTFCIEFIFDFDFSIVFSSELYSIVQCICFDVYKCEVPESYVGFRLFRSKNCDCSYLRKNIACLWIKIWFEVNIILNDTRKKLKSKKNTQTMGRRWVKLNWNSNKFLQRNFQDGFRYFFRKKKVLVHYSFREAII